MKFFNSFAAYGQSAIAFFILPLCFIFNTHIASAQVSQTFSASTLWTCPTGITSVTVQCWGGGGAGGSAKASTFFRRAFGGGGAGGAYASKTIAVVPGVNYTVTVGAAVSSSIANNAVVNGNPSWFGTAGTVYAQGGAGGMSKSGAGNGIGGTGSSASSVGTVKNPGGNGVTAAGNYGGGGGSSAGILSGGNAGLAFRGGTAPYGGGAGGGGTLSGNGLNGAAPGGGGGGAAIFSTAQRTGGDGAAGQVILIYAACPLAPVINPASATICRGTVQSLAVGAGYNTPHSGVTGAGVTFNGRTTYPNPLNTTRYGEWTQCLVTTAQLAGMGYIAGSSITSLALIVQAVNGNAALKNFTISMGLTNAGTLTTSFITNVSQVYTSASYIVTPGVNTWTFTSPFYWDGLSNVVVEFIFDGPTATLLSGGGASTYYTATAGNTVTYYSDLLNAGSLASVKNNGYASGAASNKLPNIIFTGTNASTTWLPVAGLFSDAVASIPYTTSTAATTVYASPVITTTYNVNAANGGCIIPGGNTTIIVKPDSWIGVTSADWNDVTNWSCGTLPSSTTDVVIPAGTPHNPVVSAATAFSNNITIATGASVTVTGQILTIAAAITNTGTFDASNGAIELNGSSPQLIAAGTFLSNSIKDLIISNANGVTLGGPIDVYNSVTFGAVNARLITGGNLTLKSNSTETARIGDMTNHTITGDVTVERYIATGTTGAPNHGKSWQLLAIPTSGSQTIKAAWQEGATASNISTLGVVGPGNPVAGYGMMITSAVTGAVNQPTPGFDAYTSPGPSMKIYDTLSTNYFGTASTQVPIYDQRGYFVFIRGDRSVYTSAGAATPTVLRTKGTLFNPANPPPATTVIGFAGGGDFAMVGNPYASSIDLRNIIISGGTQQFFTVWDPRIGGSYNYGAFQTLSYDNATGHFYATPGGGSYGAGPADYIQSGQAFFVQAFGANGTVSFTENCKANGSALFTTPNPASTVLHILRSSLYAVNDDGTAGNLLDGALSSFGDTFSNAVDGMDARKAMNGGENLAIKTAGILLAIERRQTITHQDTIFLNLTNEKAQPYRLQFDAADLDPSVQGFVADTYTNTRIPLNMIGATVVDFNVANVTGSNAANRFMIIFEPAKTLPVTFTSIKAYRQAKDIDVQWTVNHEVNMKQYEVEKSTNGAQFTTIDTRPAVANNGGSALYVSTDVNPVGGFNYYRIRSVDINGTAGYTTVVKVLVGSLKQDITIYPNPVRDGTIRLQFINEPAGKYKIRLLNKPGQVIMQKQITRADNNGTELITWDHNMAHGTYLLEVTSAGGTLTYLNVSY